MTPILLVDELVEFIKPVVVEYVLQSNVKNVNKAPQVVGGFMDEKKPGPQQNPPDFPFVIVRYLEDNDTTDSNIAQVRIIAGTYSEDAQSGWRDALNVITRIKGELLKHPRLNGGYTVEKPMRMEMPEEQPFPEWVATLTINVSLPQMIDEEGDVIRVIEGEI